MASLTGSYKVPGISQIYTIGGVGVDDEAPFSDHNTRTLIVFISRVMATGSQLCDLPDGW